MSALPASVLPATLSGTAASENAAPSAKPASKMYVVKRNGKKEDVHFDKITDRLTRLCEGLNSDFVDPVFIAQRVVQGIYPGVTTVELDTLAAETAASYAADHPDFNKLAARIEVSVLHKTTESSFSALARKMHAYVHPVTKLPAPLLAEDVAAIIAKNAERLDAAIDYSRDFDFDFFGFMTLMKSYLLKMNDKVAERPQHMFMRVALGIHKADVDAALETYELMSRKYFIHATPTLFNAGTPVPQMSSCFLLAMKEDSIDGIYDTLKQCAVISKHAGGIGLSVQNIRCEGSYIRGTNGYSNGLVPMLRVYNDTARYVDQGGGKRKGSFAIYIEPWHADIEAVLDLKKNHGKEETRARDMFYALWTPDLFMERVKDDGMWSLFCPNEAPGLADVHSAAFNELYAKYESTPGLARKVVKARALFHKICTAQIETGQPYMVYKDACNRKSNQQNLGTIRSSNLCTEIVEYSSPDEVAVCNLASINLSAFVKDAYLSTAAFDFDELVRVTGVVTKNLNKVIDETFYPVAEARASNMRHRPIGVGVQGLADVFAMMRFPFESPEAADLNKEIFESIYYGAVKASMNLAKKHEPYASFAGSPTSKGKLQFDLWNDDLASAPSSNATTSKKSRHNWEELRADVVAHGLRNSLLTATMPTASTSQILGNNECFEPFTSNLYSRRTLAGDFTVINRHMLKDLVEQGLWTKEVRNQVIADGGSIQNVAAIPASTKALYKTVWEITQKAVISMAADRGPYICQSQSLNIHIRSPNADTIGAMHFFGFKKGLKTGMYYLRTRPKAEPTKITVDRRALSNTKNASDAAATMANKHKPTVSGSTHSNANNDDDQGSSECLMCGS